MSVNYSSNPAFKCFQVTPPLCISLEFTSEPEALPQRPDRQASNGEAEVGNGIQGLFGVGGWLHEHAGEKDSQSLYYGSSCSLFSEECLGLFFFCKNTKFTCVSHCD